MTLKAAPPEFDAVFRAKLTELFAWRRDVRRFRQDPVAPALIADLLAQADLAPSVGDSRPWRWVSVDAPEQREAILANFRQANADALAHYAGARADLYARLKLEGLAQAPRQFAVFCAQEPERGAGLGRRTMPQTLDYSAVGSIMLFWLAARAAGLGVGWVSILDPQAVRRTLAAPADWRLIAYLCAGWPQEEHLDPELVRHGWTPPR